VAASLCVGGPAKYIAKVGSNVICNWLITEFVPHIAKKVGQLCGSCSWESSIVVPHGTDDDVCNSRVFEGYIMMMEMELKIMHRKYTKQH
jgi:hypothetical protein